MKTSGWILFYLAIAVAYPIIAGLCVALTRAAGLPLPFTLALFAGIAYSFGDWVGRSILYWQAPFPKPTL